MIKIKYRSLPNGFIYIVSKKEIKLFLKNVKNIDFIIQYDGLSFGRHQSWSVDRVRNINRDLIERLFQQKTKEDNI